MKPHLPLILFVSVLLLGCKGPRDLQMKVNNRPINNLTASAQVENGQWVIEMDLPIGSWTVKPEEDQPFAIIKGDPKSILRWKVTSERWSKKEHPFNFQLLSESGPPIYCSVKYVSKPGVTSTVMHVICELGLLITSIK